MHIIKQKREKNETGHHILKCFLKNVIGLLQKNSEFFFKGKIMKRDKKRYVVPFLCLKKQRKDKEIITKKFRVKIKR